MLKTRIGRYFLLAVLSVLALVALQNNWISGGMPSAQPAPSRPHRPQAGSHDGEVITLSVTWSAKKKPDQIGWAIGSAENYVHMDMVQDVPPMFSQTLVYDHTKRYEIWAHGSRPLHCVIVIDGHPVDHDDHVAPPPPRQAAGSVDGDVHCWVDPL